MSANAGLAIEHSDSHMDLGQMELLSSGYLQDSVRNELASFSSLPRTESPVVAAQFGKPEILGASQEAETVGDWRKKSLPPSLTSWLLETPTRSSITVKTDGHEMQSRVLLPEDYDPARKYPVVVGFHSYPGDGDGFGQLIGADRLTQQGMIVVLPSAEGGMWKSDRVGGISYFSNPFKKGHDDIAGVKETLDVIGKIYSIDRENVNFIAHGQGVPVATELARQLDLEAPGSVDKLFLTSGTMVNTNDSSIALRGTDVVHYEPGSDWVQDLGNLVTGTDSTGQFLSKMIETKNCGLTADLNNNGVNFRVYNCADGASVFRLYEKNGEVSYPGQPERFDGIFGAGSTSKVDMTQIVINMIKQGRLSRNP
ncbi:MAG: hypothetical protein AB7W16_21370 [Candidatus Obscuribacterales bacterium]